MKTIIIADNLVNDFCGVHSNYREKNVHIGQREVENIFGSESNFGNGPLPTFIKNQLRQKETALLLFRNCFDPHELEDNEIIEILGEHCVKGSSGYQFLDFLEDYLTDSEIFDCNTLSMPLLQFRDYLLSNYSIDILS